MKLLSTIVLASAVSVSSAFVSSTRSATSSTQRQPSTNDEQQSDLLTVMRMSNDDGKDAGGGPFGGFNPLKEIGDMFQNLDDGELIGRCLVWCCGQCHSIEWNFVVALLSISAGSQSTTCSLVHAARCGAFRHMASTISLDPIIKIDLLHCFSLA